MLSALQKKSIAESPKGYSDLGALFLNCTLKKSPELSHTEGLIEMSKAIMEGLGVSVDVVRPVDLDLAHGVYPDMREHGWETDEWPELYRLFKPPISS